MPHSANQPSSPFSPRELGLWREMLQRERDRICRGPGADGRRAGAERSIGIASNHPAEGASSENDRRLNLASAEEEEGLLRLIERAIAKIDHASALPFGICEWTRAADRARAARAHALDPGLDRGRALLRGQWLRDR